MITSKITKRGQTTLPRQIRNALRLETGQSLVYEIKGDTVVIRPHSGASASFGALKRSAGQPVNYTDARREARADWVEAVAEAGK